MATIKRVGQPLLVGASFHLIASRVQELGPELAELAGMFEPIAA